MTTLLLIRHATTATTGKRLGGRTETPLDDGGRREAEALAGRLAEVPMKALYASPLRRTMETAAAVGARLGLDARPCDGVIEVDYGSWTDRPLKQLARTKQWQVVQSTPSLVAFPGGETLRAMQARAVDAVDGLVAAHRREVIGVVTHADVVKALVAFYLGQPLDCFQRLHVATASVTMLQLEPGGRPMLLRLNDDGPLAAERFRGPPRTTKEGARG